jgi:flavin-dependent dehydrogenase
MVDESILERLPELEGLAVRRTRFTRLHLNNQLIDERENPNLLFIRRDLDAYLARRARKAGVDLRDDHKVIDATVHDTGVTVTCKDGEVFEGRMLVDASGAKGRLFARHKEMAYNRLYYKVVSLVLEAPCPNEVIERRMGFDVQRDLTYYDAHLMTGFIGYGWVFPKDGMVNVGLGTITPEGHRLKGMFDGFLEMTGFQDLDRSNLRAGLIPAALLSRLWLPRVLFVGDAGGFVNALTGGGIMYGICSGEIAAATAREAVRTDDFSGNTLRAFEVRSARIRRELNLRTMALYYLAGAVKRGLDQPFVVRPLLRTLAGAFD